MIDLGKWAFGHSKLVYFLLAVLLVGGLKSAYDMGKLEDPEVKVKIAMVVGGSSGSVGARNGTGSDRPAGKGDPYRRRGGQYAELVVQRPLHHTGRTQKYDAR